MKRLCIFFASIWCFTCCTPKITVKQASSQTSLVNKMFYALPRNTLDFEIGIGKTVYSPGANLSKLTKGCLCDLEKKYGIPTGLLKKLRSLGANQTHTEVELLEDSVSVHQGALPDVKKIYMVNLSPKMFRENVMGISFTEDWIMSESSFSSENKTYETLLTTSTSILGTIGAFSKGGGVALIQPAACDAVLTADLDKSIKELNAFILNPGGNTVNSEIYKAAKSAYQKSVDSEFGKVFYSSKSKEYKVIFRVDLNDAMLGGAEFPLFSINKETGTVNFLKSASYIRTNSDKVEFVDKLGESYKMTCSLNGADVYAAIHTKLATNYKPDDATGLVYNIPATVNIKLKSPENEQIISDQYKIAQFGGLGYLDPRLSKVGVTLDPLTGSLQKVSGESHALGTSNISGTSDAIAKGKDTFKKPSETDELESKAKILELKAKIKELEGNQ